MLAVAVLLGATAARAQSLPTTTASQKYSFTFTLPGEEGLSSAGAYNARGDLVRTLWSLESTSAGSQLRQWDGRDDFGRSLPDGSYTFKVETAATAVNVGEIGNTGVPTTTAGHVPVNFESVAINPSGRIFTVHDWDEAHFDVIEWSAANGRSIANSGHPVGGLLKAIAADDDAVYVSTYDDAYNPKKAKFYIYKLALTSKGITRTTFSAAGAAIKVYDGTAVSPTDVPADDLALMKNPLLSLAVHGQLLYVTDALAGLVRIYDKDTGEAKQSIRVPLPRAVAVAADGTIWVAHSHHDISVFAGDGSPIATPISDASDICGISFGAAGQLYVADRGANVVRHYRVIDNRPQLVGTLGEPAQPGDRAADRFYRLRGVAADAAGNVVTIQDEYFFNGGRIARFSPDGKAQWEQMGLEFQSNGTYGADDPSTFYSMMHHAYRLDRANGTASYLGNTVDGALYRGSAINGVPRVVRLGPRDFYYMPTGDGLEVFRIDQKQGEQRGPVMRLCSVIAGNQPLPNGTSTTRPWIRDVWFLWSWHDSEGSHHPDPLTMEYAMRPHVGKEFPWQHGPMDVDSKGDIWFVSYDRGGRAREANSIFEIPLSGLDALGNPIYRWADAKPVVPSKSLPWKIQLRTVVHAGGGLTYAYGNSTSYPGAPKNGGLWMGGNSLLAYDGGDVKWMVPLNQLGVGLDVVPPGPSGEGGGVVIGAEPAKGGIYYYSTDGLLVCRMFPSAAMGEKPNGPTGTLDMYSAVTANRDPADGLVDVFVEDDFNDRILWYRVTDRADRVVTGTMTRMPAD